MAINFDLNDLLAFRAVAELANFRKAAEAVHIIRTQGIDRFMPAWSASDLRL